MSTDYYARLERGTGPQPSEQMIASIAQGLHLSLGQFYGPKRTTAGPPVLLDKLWTPLQNMDAARRLWDTSERLVDVRSAA